MRDLCLIVLIVAGTVAWTGASLGGVAKGGTIAYWRFENDLLDESTNHNDAAHPGTAVFDPEILDNPVPRTGAANTRSLKLINTVGNNAAVDYLSVVDHPSLDFATGLDSFTIEAFVKLNDFGSNNTRQYLLQKNDIDAGDLASSYIFLPKAGNLASSIAGYEDQSVMALGLPNAAGTDITYIFSTPDNTNTPQVEGLGIDNGDWHHVSVAVDRSNGDVRFTRDGIVDLHPGAAVGAMFVGRSNTSPLYIGGHPFKTSESKPLNHGFDGYIDELRISDEFLATNQLLAVPEPSAVVTLMTGIVLLLAWRRRRRRGT